LMGCGCWRGFRGAINPSVCSKLQKFISVF
jgi:hypothetical protein